MSDPFEITIERLSCENNDCDQLAYKFCLNCKKFLCRRHRIDDVRKQQIKSGPEHYYTDALEYRCNEDKFISLYCKEHPDKMLIRRCINCFQFACSECCPQWCDKAAGRYHDYCMIKDSVGSYQKKWSELWKKLQQRHEIFLMSLKDACHEVNNTRSELENLLLKIDVAVESQIAVVIKEGSKLKEEIRNEMRPVISQITQQISCIEEKEVMCRQLLADMHKMTNSVGGSLAVHNYQRLQEEVTNLIKWRIPKAVSPRFFLSQVTEGKHLHLELTKTGASSVVASEEEEAPENLEEKKTEIIEDKDKSYTSVGQSYWGLSLLAEDQAITYGWDSLSRKSFTERREGETISRQTCDPPVRQLLQYGDQLILVTSGWDSTTWHTEYKINFQDRVLHQFKYPYDYSLFYSPKLVAVTSDHQLMVLHQETQTLRVVHLQTNEEKEIRLLVPKRVYGVIASSDNNLILLCVDGEEEEIHSVIKYNPAIWQEVWSSDPLLTDTQADGDHLLRDPLNVAAFMEYLYVLSHHQPTMVFRVDLNNGLVVQKILYDGFPKAVYDISLRGNTLVTASFEKISYYKITDIEYVI